jgi:hypothetical protein
MALSSPPLMPLRIFGPASGLGPEGLAEDLPWGLPAGLLKFAIRDVLGSKQRNHRYDSCALEHCYEILAFGNPKIKKLRIF